MGGDTGQVIIDRQIFGRVRWIAHNQIGARLRKFEGRDAGGMMQLVAFGDRRNCGGKFFHLGGALGLSRLLFFALEGIRTHCSVYRNRHRAAQPRFGCWHLGCPGLSKVPLRSRLSRCLQICFARTGQLLIAICLGLAQTGFGNGGGLRLSRGKKFRSGALRLIQFPHQLADSHTGAQFDFAGPDLKFGVVALASVSLERSRLVLDFGSLVDASAPLHGNAHFFVSDERADHTASEPEATSRMSLESASTGIAVAALIWTIRALGMNPTRFQSQTLVWLTPSLAANLPTPPASLMRVSTSMPYCRTFRQVSSIGKCRHNRRTGNLG